MDVRHLDLLRELATRGTLAAVAEATHRTPSALSQQLRTAEREFGVRLVEREGRGLRLTAEGRLLAEGAEEVNAALATVRARLDAARGEVGGPVSIGCFPSAGAALLPELVLRFEGTGVELNLDDFDLMEAEYAGRTLDHDIVIAHSLSGEGPAGAERLVRRVLAREPIDVALPAAHPLAARAALRPQDLRGTVWVGVPAGYPFDHLLIAIETAAGERFPRRHRTMDVPGRDVRDSPHALIATSPFTTVREVFDENPRIAASSSPILSIKLRCWLSSLSTPVERRVVQTI